MTLARAAALTVDSAVPYLLGRGLLAPAEVVDGELRVTSAAYRHRQFRVERRLARGAAGRDRSRGYLLKQTEPSLSDARASFRAEVLFYRLCREEPCLAALASFLAPPRLVDADRRVLVFDFLDKARPLASTRALPSVPPTAALGRALGILHRDGASLVADPRLASQRSRPSVFHLHRPPLSAAARLSGAQRQLLEILQEHSEIGEHLDAAAEMWTVGATLLHCDVRSDNVLVLPAPADGVEIRLVDWELFRTGDPAWDVAGAFQDLLSLWIRGLPFDPGLTGDERARRARHPLAVLHPLFAAFWQHYAAAAGLDVSGACLSRAVRFSAVRLLATVYEWGQGASELPAPAVTMLQVSTNILAEPERARAELYGLGAANGGASG